MPEQMRSTKIVGANGVELSVRINAAVQPKAVVIIVHGLAEHSGRYEYVTNRLNLMNYTVYRFDNRGHGNSGGDRGFVDDYHFFIEDADQIVKLAQTEHPNLPVFMLGHSMGGFIAAAYGVEHPNKLRGQILSGAAVILQPSLKALQEMDFDAMAHDPVPNSLSEQICRDSKVIEAYNNDPQVLKEFKFKLLGEVFIKGAIWLMESMPSYDYPCFILHGGEDQIVTPDASRYMYERIVSNDKSLRIYDGLFHEILNEPEKDQVLSDIDQWISARLQ